ncbi:MAG TPA: hypothetical protein VN699_16705 [Pirellulales bacterium]|nr:hypothetical protein [Pirellulales bacterium]
MPADPPAPPAPARGFWALAAYAPLGDWFEPGSQRTLDVRKIIHDARLPGPLPGLIYLGLRRSRRSRRQRAALARELIAAFSTSLASGESPREIAERFREQEARGHFLPRSKRRPRLDLDLPAPAAEWIERLLARARLQPALASQAAGELAEHFVARLAAGESAADLIEQFGAAERAARLLRSTRLPAAVLLPAPLRNLLDAVLVRARLWQSERADIARELTDHFDDGLAAGRSPEQLVVDFGDPRQAARLIRRAKLRSRPLAWRLLRHSLQGLSAVTGAVLLLYVLLFVRYVTGRPTISHNYLADFNREPQAVPPDDRAWPLYREALLMLPTAGRPNALSFGTSDAANESRPSLAAYLDEHRETLALIRQAASKPRFGFIYGDPANRDFLMKFASGADAHGESPDRYDRWLIECVLPQHQEIRFLGELLYADARRASEAGNGSKYADDVLALIGMAEHNEDAAPFLVVKLISSAIYRMALHVTATVAAERPELCSDEQWKRLAHAIAAYAEGGTLRWRLDGDRDVLDDFLQRTFTDDGEGGGRLTPEGFRRLYRDFNAAGPVQGRLALAWRTWGVELGLAGPLMSAEMANRKELMDLADRLWDEAEADYARPMWQWQESSAEKTMRALASSPLERTRYWPVLDLLPGTASYMVPLVAELTTQRRDATLTAIALELYHRRHNAWPATLDELAPSLLPAVPLDRFTGRPLCYRIIDGRPLVYSCGVDGDDDGGRPPKAGNEVASRWGPEAKLDADTIASAWAAAQDGDWILWPSVEKEWAE